MDFLFSNSHHWILQSVAMAFTALILPQLKITSILGPFLAVLTLAFVNAKFWDAALFFHLPESFSIQTALLLIANGILFWVVIKLVPGIEIEGFFGAVAAPIVFTLCSFFINKYADVINWDGVFQWVLQIIDESRDYFQKNPVLNENAVQRNS